MIAAIKTALQYDVAGDPITGVRWTHRTTDKIAAEPRSTFRSVLAPWPVSSRTSTTGCASTTSGSRPAPPRTVQQFDYIAE